MAKSPRVIWLEENVDGQLILDIGFVGEYEESFVHKSIVNKNPQSTVVGLDIKEDIANHACDEGVRGDLFQLPFDDNTFDAVVFAEVLEHISNPADSLDEISRILSNQGNLYLTTPNPFGFYRYLRHYLLKKDLDTEFYLGADDHCQFVDPMSLSKLLHSSGMKVDELTFRNVSLPKVPTLPDWTFLRSFPFNRAGGYTCIKAIKSE